jgi:hypothetical protein
MAVHPASGSCTSSSPGNPGAVGHDADSAVPMANYEEFWMREHETADSR